MRYDEPYGSPWPAPAPVAAAAAAAQLLPYVSLTRGKSLWGELRECLHDSVYTCVRLYVQMQTG